MMSYGLESFSSSLSQNNGEKDESPQVRTFNVNNDKQILKSFSCHQS